MARPRSDRLDWTGAGYHTFPLAGKPDPDRDAYLWRDFERVLERVKRGDFAAAPELVDLYDRAESWLLSRAYISLLGDAGTPAAFARVVPVLAAVVEPSYQVYLSEATTTWGKLAVVPLVLAGWEALEGFDDADAIPGYLSRVLEEQPGPVAGAADRDNPEAYRAVVMGRYAELEARFGTNEVLLFRGEPVSVRRIATLVLDQLAETGRLDRYLRRRFEAFTGIDCSPFYENGSLRPLAAAAVVEEFLEDPAAAKYEDGVRYFFGHRIPD